MTGGFKVMTSKFTKALKGAALISAMALGVMISSSTNVAAQHRDRDDDRDDRYQQNRGYNDDRYYDRDRNNNSQRTRAAYNKGYRDGVKAGERAARSNRNGYYGGYETNGYGNYGGYGNNGGYNNYGNGRGNYEMRQAYTQGYQRGYQDGYNRRNRNQRTQNSSWWPF
jgi:hypothetical protein